MRLSLSKLWDCLKGLSHKDAKGHVGYCCGSSTGGFRMSGDIDFVTPSELEEMATYIQTEQADDRKRITQLEDKI